ncbi:MAG TPA: phosphoglucosamine mutase [Mycobacteriales bacterium]|nr:phosphoglucosamine mutase [Mycobacteriales bacterium]
MPRLFGTDGVRGVANGDLTPELALRLAVAAAHELLEQRGGAAGRPLAVVGRDTRPSGELLEAAVAAGLLGAGVDVELLGVTPTPAVAHAVTADGVDLGVMISASHNPMPDNGIKFFAHGGYKLADETEARIEAHLGESWERPTGAGVGRRHDADASRRSASYVDHLVASVPKRLDGVRVVVDCANGAASAVGPAAYRAAGADVVVINDDVAGYRINDGCGATHPEAVAEAVRVHGADIGLAHDGDADRCVAVDSEGRVVDGDQILAVLALGMKERGRLAGDTVVATVMSNLGFKKAMAEHGIAVADTAVGDRYVLERMRADGYRLGGEQSGHVILLDHATTGDGVLTGLHLVARMAETGRSLADLASVVTRLPQVLVNVRVADKDAAMSTLTELSARADAALGADGRVLVRPSGTEPLIRVMVEAPTEEQATEVAETLAAAVR